MPEDERVVYLISVHTAELQCLALIRSQCSAVRPGVSLGGGTLDTFTSKSQDLTLNEPAVIKLHSSFHLIMKFVKTTYITIYIL